MENEIITKDSIKETVELLLNTGAKNKEVQTFVINGETYSTEQLERIDKRREPHPDVVHTATLSGLVEYLNNDLDENVMRYGKLYVSVKSPTEVVVFTPIVTEDKERFEIAYCETEKAFVHTDRFMSSDDFQVMAQTSFVQSPNRDLVLRFTGSLADEQSTQTGDDGFSQKVTIKSGVTRVSDVEIKNPVYLAPRRTFPEVAQPESPYILRIKEGPEVALFTTTDMTWRNEAIRNIGMYLRDKLKENFVVLA